MSHAKVKGDVMVKFPYTVMDFLKENPSNYAPKVSLDLAYEGTEDQAKTGCSVVLVPVEEMSDRNHNKDTHYISSSDVPTFWGGKWIRRTRAKDIPANERAADAHWETIREEFG